MKKLLCLMIIALLMAACSSDSTDTAAQPQPSESQSATDVVQQTTDAVKRATDQVVEKGQELKEEAREYAEKASEVAAERVQDLQSGAQRLADEGSTRLAALVPSAVDFDRGRSVYQQSCSNCHDGGLMGAPKIGHSRYSADIEVLTENTIKGIGRMPARGGNPRLSDDDIRAAVEYMVEQSK